MSAYRQIASQGVDNLDVASAHTIVQRLKETPEGLDPLLDLLEDPNANPVAKVLTVISMAKEVTPEMAPRLIGMTQPSHETTTRACATHLLAHLKAPEAQTRVRELLSDSEHRVRAAAIMALGALQQDPEVIAQLPSMWAAPETTAADKDQILLMLPEEHVRQNLNVYKDALLDHSLEPKSRERLAVILGRVGNASVLDVLEKAAEEDPVDFVRVMARGAVGAIEAREAAAAATGAEPAAAPEPVTEAAPAAAPTEPAPEAPANETPE
jgi:HEAT repeat protein